MNDWQEQVRRILQDASVETADSDAEEIARVAVEKQPDDSAAAALAMARDRASGTQLAFVTGRVHFLGVEMLADDGALAPREETEILGKGALARIQALQEENPDRALRIIDMCCGAGNLACAIARKFPTAQVWASDLTDGCVSLSRRNVAFLGLEDRVHVVQGDLFEPLRELELEDSIDVIVCNPPYISSGKLETDRAELLDQEPREAFDGGPYGLSIHQRVVKDALSFLAKDGWLMMEFGLGQDRQMAILFKRSRRYTPVTFEHNEEGNPRAVFARKKAE